MPVVPLSNSDFGDSSCRSIHVILGKARNTKLVSASNCLRPVDKQKFIAKMVQQLKDKVDLI